MLGVTGAGAFGWTYAIGENQSGPGVLTNPNQSSDSGANWLDDGSLNPYPVRV